MCKHQAKTGLRNILLIRDIYFKSQEINAPNNISGDNLKLRSTSNEVLARAVNSKIKVY